MKTQSIKRRHSLINVRGLVKQAVLNALPANHQYIMASSVDRNIFVVLASGQTVLLSDILSEECINNLTMSDFSENVQSIIYETP